MRLLFCSDPLAPAQPDLAYEAEVAAADELGIPYDLMHVEALVNEQNPERAVRRVPIHDQSELVLYRGWMLTVAQYAQLYAALASRGVRLINDPAAYRTVQYLPDAYPFIERYTPRSVWLRTAGQVSDGALAELLAPFGESPVVVKDFVKSRKHEWEEACFIPSAADRQSAACVVRRMLALQGDDLNEGLVVREYIPFTPLGTHPQSGMPLTKEFRVFVFDGVPVYTTEYWDAADYDEVRPPVDLFADVMRSVPSRFFTMDVAQRRDGGWMIVELGDGQVAGLPDHANARDLFRVLQARWPGMHQTVGS